MNYVQCIYTVFHTYNTRTRTSTLVHCVSQNAQKTLQVDPFSSQCHTPSRVRGHSYSLSDIFQATLPALRIRSGGTGQRTKSTSAEQGEHQTRAMWERQGRSTQNGISTIIGDKIHFFTDLSTPNSTDLENYSTNSNSNDILMVTF